MHIAPVPSSRAGHGQVSKTRLAGFDSQGWGLVKVAVQPLLRNPHIEGFGTSVLIFLRGLIDFVISHLSTETIMPTHEQEFSMDDDIWDFLGYVEDE